MKMEFYLSDHYADRLWLVKRAMGKDEMTGNEFARYLLEKELYRLHPAFPTDADFDD